jgi:hypothetical protein
LFFFFLFFVIAANGVLDTLLRKSTDRVFQAALPAAVALPASRQALAAPAAKAEE